MLPQSRAGLQHAATFDKFAMTDSLRPCGSNQRGVCLRIFTGSDGFHRLANQATFTDNMAPGRYLVVDEFVGHDGTPANLNGYVHSRGGSVIGATVFTGKPYSATISSDIDALARLRDKHGKTLENGWKANFGFGFDRLTRSETRYLEKTADADTIRDRIAEAREPLIKSLSKRLC